MSFVKERPLTLDVSSVVTFNWVVRTFARFPVGHDPSAWDKVPDFRQFRATSWFTEASQRIPDGQWVVRVDISRVFVGVSLASICWWFITFPVAVTVVFDFLAIPSIGQFIIIITLVFSPAAWSDGPIVVVDYSDIVWVDSYATVGDVHRHGTFRVFTETVWGDPGGEEAASV